MKKNEQDILNIIEEKTKEIIVPETLNPEVVEERLKKAEWEKQKKRRRRHYCLGGLAAACVVLVVGSWVGSQVKRSGVDHAVKEAVESEESGIRTAESYDDIYECIENQNEYYNNSSGSLWDGIRYFGTGIEEAATEDSAASVEMSAGSLAKTTSVEDYSMTNVRQEGVDEADSVKTDGRYLYVLKENSQSISIIDTENGMQEVNCVEAGDKKAIQEFYMLPDEKQLVLICSFCSDELLKEMYGDESEYMIEDVLWTSDRTQVITYDISDVKNPERTGELTQSGAYTSSRMADGFVYLFSEQYVGGAEKNEPSTYMPLVDDDMMRVENVYLPVNLMGCMYEIITSVDLTQPDKVKDSKAIFTEGGQCYVSNQNIYYYETQWTSDDSGTTTIRKISYDNGELKAEAQGKIAGYINDSFCIDEYEGYLRAVTTAGDTNSVYVLNKKLDITGKIEGLAKDERVYSARFMGETGYFVTFRETDPLFTVDLSNPKAPKIIGKLKIPGFSEYLHFYGENKLLGIGMNVDEKTGITEGVKLTMFDISDKTDVKEAETYIMENVYSTDVEYDYKAALIDVNKNMIGFAGYTTGLQKYFLFSYDEKEGFICNMAEEINGNGNRSARGVYIGDMLYVVQGNVIESYSLLTYEKEDDLIL